MVYSSPSPSPSPSPSSYTIHDNGGRPFVVDVYPHRIAIIRLNDSGDRGEVVYESEYERVWVGDNLLSLPNHAPRGTSKGNTLLVQISAQTYLFIGHEVYRFSLRRDEIIEYYSPIGNSDVPYPYAIGGEYCYFFLDKKRVLTSAMDVSQDGYTQFYHLLADDQKVSFSVEVIATPIYGGVGA